MWRRHNHLFCTLLLLCSLYVSFICSNEDDEGPGRGLGNNFDWQSLDDGLEASKRSNKPLMLIIHKSWCGACKAFKPKFAESSEIADLSSQFVMVNAQDDDEPVDDKYVPDGSYIPRILFLDSSGDVMLDVYNESGNQNYRFYYYDAEGVIGSMRKALEVMKESRHLSDEL